MEKLPERIKQLRGNMSRRAFAKTIDLPEGTLRNYEQGTSQPKFDALCQISQKLDVSLDWLVFGKGPVRPGEATPKQAVAPPPPPALPIETQAQQSPPPNGLLHAQAEEMLKQMAVMNERLHQAWERERALMEDVSDLRSEIAALKQSMVDREAYYRDLRDIYGMGEEDIGVNVTSAFTAPMKSAGSK